ncbi:hypothetical protein [Aureimonas altamirensis]|nr:hypothetical protein [Aureimonas altamirensis]
MADPTAASTHALSVGFDGSDGHSPDGLGSLCSGDRAAIATVQKAHSPE